MRLCDIGEAIEEVKADGSIHKHKEKAPSEPSNPPDLTEWEGAGGPPTQLYDV